MARTSPEHRLYKIARDRAVTRLGGPAASRVVGDQIFRAFVAQEILTVIATQDEGTDAEAVRLLATSLYDALTDEFQMA